MKNTLNKPFPHNILQPIKRKSDDERLKDCGGNMNKLGNATLGLFMTMSTWISLSGVDSV
jgi:hypothetical protein